MAEEKARYFIRGKRHRSSDWETLYAPGQDVSLEMANYRFDSLKSNPEILQTYSEFELEVVKRVVLRKATCVLEFREETRHAT